MGHYRILLVTSFIVLPPIFAVISPVSLASGMGAAILKSVKMTCSASLGGYQAVAPNMVGISNRSTHTERKERH